MQVEDVLAALRQLATASSGSALGELLDVGARDERLVAGARDHDDADRRIVPHLEHGAAQTRRWSVRFNAFSTPAG